MKKISTKTHGMIDYASAVGLLAIPRIFKMNSSVTRLLTGSAIMTTIYSMLTKYELGVFKVLPMKTHKVLDGVQSAALAAAPLTFVDSRKSTTAALIGLAALEGLITLRTASRPKRKFLWFHI